MRAQGIPYLVSLIVVPSITESFVPYYIQHSKQEKPFRMSQDSSDAPSEETMKPAKRIIFLRHGRTYMNDFIGGINYGTPNFTDVFPDTPEYNYKYMDSPLTQEGIDQAKKLHYVLKDLDGGSAEAKQILSLSTQDVTILDDLELVLTSPLTRALQTLEIGLYPTIQQKQLPIMALPLATERVYLISDIGKMQSELKKEYIYVDFNTAFPEGEYEPWYFTPDDDLVENYIEWRPCREGQVYSCLGEPQGHFDRRMSELYRFLDNREESTIAVVCHAGVIDWFVQEIFENCELRVINFDDLKPRSLVV